MRFLIPVLFVLAACGKDEPPPKKAKEHTHEAQYGGQILVLGDHEAHMEVKLNHHSGEMSMWFTSSAGAPLTPDEAPVFSCVIGEEPLQLTSEGEEDMWSCYDEKLKGEPKKGEFRVKIGGRTFTPLYVHSHPEPKKKPEGE